MTSCGNGSLGRLSMNFSPGCYSTYRLSCLSCETSHNEWHCENCWLCIYSCFIINPSHHFSPPLLPELLSVKVYQLMPRAMRYKYKSLFLCWQSEWNDVSWQYVVAQQNQYQSLSSNDACSLAITCTWLPLQH